MSELAQFGRGANDTAAAYGSIVHGRPDPVQLSLQVSNPNPMYDHIKVSDPAYQRAYENLHVFRDSMINNRPKGPASTETDHIWYMQTLNGLYSSTDKPWRLAARMIPYGVTEDDILALEGPAQTNTVLMTGKSTSTNTGPYPIKGGQYYYLDFPSTDKTKMYKGGCSFMDGVPENYLCLWTMAFDENLHRCIPIAMHKFFSDTEITEDEGDFGQKVNANKLIDSALDTAIVALALLAKRGVIAPGVLEAAVTAIKTPGGQDQNGQAIYDFKTEFADVWLAPMLDPANRLFGGLAALENLPTLSFVPAQEVFEGGSAFLPTSLEVEAVRGKRMAAGKRYSGPSNIGDIPNYNLSYDQQILLSQLTASEDLCMNVNEANRFYSRRIVGRAETTADPGMEMERLAAHLHD